MVAGGFLHMETEVAEPVTRGLVGVGDELDHADARATAAMPNRAAGGW